MNELSEIHGMALDVLVVEDAPGDARLLDALLTRDGRERYCVCQVASLEAAVAVLETRRIDVVLLDPNLPDSQGLATVRQILDVADGLPVIVLADCDDDDLDFGAMRLGAQDVLVKGRDWPASVRRSLRFAMLRQESVNRMSRRVHSASASASSAAAEPAACALVVETLSPRLRELLPMLVAGLSNKQIARRMAVTEATVKLHVRRLCKALGAANRTRAALLAAVMVEEGKTKDCTCKGSCRVIRNLRRIAAP